MALRAITRASVAVPLAGACLNGALAHATGSLWLAFLSGLLAGIAVSSANIAMSRLQEG